jgi:hypothetical protein
VIHPYPTIAGYKKDDAWIIPGKISVVSGAVLSVDRRKRAGNRSCLPFFANTFKTISTTPVKIHFVIRITEAGDIL